MSRILSVVWYRVFPPSGGGQKGIVLFTRELARHHEIICICSRDNKPAVEENFRILPLLPKSKSQVLNPAVWQKIYHVALEYKVSHLLIEHPYYGRMGIWLSRKLRLKLIIHSHNLESLRFQQAANPLWRLLYQLEKSSHRAAWLNLFKTEEDLRFAIRNFSLNPNRCMVVPYGLTRITPPSESERQAATEKIRTLHQIGAKEKILLFTGSMDYAPNREAFLHILTEIGPGLLKLTPEPFRILVCGIHPEAFKQLESGQSQENIRYLGFVHDITIYYLGAEIFLNPITSGGGIRVKLMEALENGLVSISTYKGARGIDRNLAGGHLKIVPDQDWNRFCEAIVRAWNIKPVMNPSFYTHYAWKNIVRRVAEKIDLKT